MRTLDRKVWRDLLGNKGQVVSIAAVVACGLGICVALLGTHRSLASSQRAFEAAHRFPDVFARAARLPAAVVGRLAEVPGVVEAEGRVRATGRLELTGSDEAVTVHLVSLEGGENPSLEELALADGQAPDPAAPADAIVLEVFARARGLEPGDRLEVIVEGRRLHLRVSGLAMSPEWLFVLGPSGMPEERRIGVVWMPAPALADQLGRRGLYDEVVLRTLPGAEASVVEAVDRALEPYGGRGAYRRDRQLSHMFVSQELGQLEAMATRVPVLFLAVAAFLLHVVMTRLVSGQREVVAALRALGYGRGAIAAHYLELGGLIVAVGMLVGLPLGIWAGDVFTDIYARFFRFPVLRFQLDVDVLALALGMGALPGALGALVAVWRVTRLSPAEAMQPPAPARYRAGPLSWLTTRGPFGVVGRLIARELERRPVRALLSAAGLALAVALLVVGRFSLDSFDYMMDVQFGRAQRDDLAVSLVRPAPLTEVASDLRQVEGVLAVEGLRTAPVRVRAGGRRYDDAVLIGLEPGARLRRLLDVGGRPIVPPASGALLSDELARRLAVRAGDLVDVEVLEGAPRTRRVRVAGLSSEMTGMNVTMRLDALAHMLGEAPAVSTVTLQVDAAAQRGVAARLGRMAGVAGVSSRAEMLEAFEKTSRMYTGTFTLILVAFGSVLAAGVVYNNARVALAERGRDLATLRVLGFTRGEVTRILLGELGVQVIAALPLGALLGWTFAAAIMSTVDPELYRFPLVIRPATYLFAAATIVLAAAATSLLVHRRIGRLDLVAVLKTKE